ncbi:MAG TPA: hypothetical protein VI997_01450 [Candidatus Thermoplasmatota archaeon]|nr:hypothetical protein [Candidatus Thermoplasmatota archaeon]
MVRDLATGLGGIGSFLIAIVLFVPPPPHPEPPAAPTSDEAAAWMRETRLLHDYQATVHVLGSGALAVFAWGLSERVRAGAPAAARLVLASGLAVAVYTAIAMGLVLAADETVDQIGGTVALGVYGFAWILHFQTAIFTALFAAAAGAAVLASRALPPWVAWTALLVGAVNGLAVLVGPTPVAFVKFPAFLAFMVWVLATGIAAFVRPAPISRAPDSAS